MKKIVLVCILSAFSISSFAEIKTVTLDLPTMNCVTCPITVKKSLEKINGVNSADVDYKTKQAVVRFEDTKTDTKALTTATTNAGYPSTVKEI